MLPIFIIPRPSRPFSLLHVHGRRLFSSISISVPLSHPIYTIWAANTGLGKTLVSAGLASSVLSRASQPSEFRYIKPVQTGFPSDSDSRFVFNKVSDIFRRRRVAGTSLIASNHVLKASPPAAREVVGWYEEKTVEGEVSGECAGNRRRLNCTTLYAWKEAVSPHLAVEREAGGVEDEQLLGMVQNCLWKEGVDKEKTELWTVIETAGGVASPGPSGTLQCDLYRPFRIPAVLVGDGRLGGISGTVSAYESLKLRGYDVVAVVLEDRGLGNDGSLLSYVQNSSRIATCSRRSVR